MGSQRGTLTPHLGSSDIGAANCRRETVTSDHFYSHLHLVRVKTHEPLNAHFLACAGVVDVFSFLQTPLVDPHIGQLAEPPSLLKKAPANSEA